MAPKKAGGAPRGVSMDEKRRRLLAIFAELDENGRALCFNLKQLESIGSKRGVSSMLIKDIITDLVGDKLVDCEKIGSGNFYWALPSKQGQKRQARKAELTQQIIQAQAKVKSEQERSVSLQAGRMPGKQRDLEISVVQKLKQEEATISKELQRYRDRDPVVLKALKEQAVQNAATASRWGDNMHQLREYVQGHLNLTLEKFDATYETGEKDCEPVTWATFGTSL